MDAVIIRQIDLPYSINGLTVKDADGDYNIYLNARLSDDQRAAAFRHEMEHIKRGHLYAIERRVQNIEEEVGTYGGSSTT